MDEVWGYETEADPHTIEVHIGSDQPCNQCIENQKPAKHRYAARQIKEMIQKSK